MEKDKKKFNLVHLISLYLRRRNKALTASPVLLPPTTEPDDSPAPGNQWPVKLLLFYRSKREEIGIR